MIDTIPALFPEVFAVWNLPLFIFMSERKEARYIAAICSLMLMIVLVVGTLAYAGIRGLTSPVPATASVSRAATVAQPVPHQNAPALDSDPLVTPSAIVLAMIAAPAVVGRAAPPRRESTPVPHR